MYTGDRKINIISEVLNMTNESALAELEQVIAKNKKKLRKRKTDIYRFVGIFSKKETAQIKKAIHETSETIHPNDWK